MSSETVLVQRLTSARAMLREGLVDAADYRHLKQRVLDDMLVHRLVAAKTRVLGAMKRLLDDGLVGNSEYVNVKNM